MDLIVQGNGSQVFKVAKALSARVSAPQQAAAPRAQDPGRGPGARAAGGVHLKVDRPARAAVTDARAIIVPVAGQTGTSKTIDVTLIVPEGTGPLAASAGGDKSIVAGGSTSLDGSASGGTPPYTYRWDPGTGLSRTDVAAPTASPSQTTTYTLTVTDAAGRTASDAVQVTVGQTGVGDYYVAPGGNDSNPGTSEAPWRTLSKAASTAQAGQTVVVRAGTYTETLRPSRSGQAGSLITFRSETPRGAIIDGQGSRGNGVNLQGRSYIRIEGFDIRYHTNDAMYIQDWYSADVEGLELVGNYIHHNGNYTSWGGGGQGMQASNLRNSLIENNEIYHNGDTAIRLGGIGYRAANLIIRGNDIHYNGRDAITGGGSDILIEHNRFYDQVHTSLHQDCLQLSQANRIIFRYNLVGDFTQMVYGGMQPDTTDDWVDLQIYGNVFYNSRYWNDYGGTAPAIFIDCRRAGMPNRFEKIIVHSNTFLYLGEKQKAVTLYGSSSLHMDDVRIYNNIFHQVRGTGGGDAYEVDARFTNFRSDYNCFYNCSPKPGQDTNSIFADPRLTDYVQGSAEFDVRLLPDSPCIDAAAPHLGDLVPLPPDFVDMDGNPRPAGAVDIGAYEY